MSPRASLSGNLHSERFWVRSRRSAILEFRQTTKGAFKGTERDSIALIPDATKALEAEGVIIVWARDEANDQMKSIIIKGQAERAGAQKFRGNLQRDDG